VSSNLLDVSDVTQPLACPDPDLPGELVRASFAVTLERDTLEE
jgi:hypothetical protein